MSMIRLALHHVAIKTSQLSEMVAWYAAVAGAKIIFQDANNAWMTNDGANHRIAFLSVPGLEADCGTFFDPERVSQAYAASRSFESLQPAVRAGEFVPGQVPSIGLPV